MTDALIPEVVKPDQRKPREQKRYKIRNLPAPVRRELDDRLSNHRYQSLKEVSQWLAEDHREFISPSALAYYVNHEVDPTLHAVRIATAQAAEIVRSTGGDDEISLAMFRLTQTAIFDLLLQLHKTRYLVARAVPSHERSAAILRARRENAAPEGAELEPQASDQTSAPGPIFPNRIDLVAVTSLGKIVATVNKALTEWRKWRADAREKLDAKIAATGARVSEAASAGGLSAAAEKSIRDALMEIKL